MSQPSAHHASRASNDRLPPELLTEAFLYLASLFLDDDIPPNGRRQHYNVRSTKSSMYGWLAITEVCHYWRDVALSCSRLWNYIDVAAPCWAEILKRSNRTDNLHVVCRSGCYLTCVRGARHSDQDTLTAASASVLTQIHRIRSLKFFMSPCVPTRSDSNRFLSGATSQLTHLYLICSQTQVKENTVLTKSIDIFGRVPSLQYLTIKRAILRWTWPDLTHLVRLELTNVNVVDLNHFYKFLNASPGLETLILSDLDYDDDIEMPLEPYGYSLDSLRHLTLNLDFAILRDIIFHIVVPEVVSWDIKTDEEPLDFVQALADWPILSGPFIQINVYIELDGGNIDITFVATKAAGDLYGSEDNDETTITRKNMLFWSEMGLEYPGMALRRLVHENMWIMYNNLEITITDLWEIWEDVEWSYDDWRSHILCFFDHMHSIVLKGAIRGASAGCILRHLTLRSNEGEAEGAFYSNLRSIVLDNIDFSRRRTRAWAHLLSITARIPERLQTVRFLGGCQGLSLVKMDEIRERVDTVVWEDMSLDHQDEDYPRDERWFGSDDVPVPYKRRKYAY